MRVLLTRPEREAASLAQALRERGHEPLIAPLFEVRLLAAPAGFAASLAAAQAVLLTSANGARALADASEQRGVRIFAVGDTSASTAEGLGFSRVTAAAGDGAALADTVRQRLDPKAGPLLHVAGSEVAVDFAEVLAPLGFTVERVALYEAQAAESLPDAIRNALVARSLDAATFFSPRASQVFADLVGRSGLGDGLKGCSAVAISEAAAQPLSGLPFRQIVAAARPTRQAVLDEIDRLPAPGVQGQDDMSETTQDTPAATPTPPPPPPPPVQVRRGLGVFGALIVGLIASVAVLAGALVSLPHWPAELRAMWQGAPPKPTDLTQVQRDTASAAQAAAAAQSGLAQTSAALEAARHEIALRLEDLDKRVRAAAATAGEARPASAPDPAFAELRKRLEALEGRAPAAPPSTTTPTPPTAAAPAGDNDKDIAALRQEIATLRTALQAIDRSIDSQKEEVSRQREQQRLLAAALEKSATGGDMRAVAAARASAVIGIAARLSAALESGLPFAQDLGLLAPLSQGDAKLAEIVAGLQPRAASGVPSRAALAAEFPAMARLALAEDRADDSFGERLMGKVRNLISLRRVGADVAGDTAEARLARAEAALEAGDVAKAYELVKSLPPITAKATAAWVARAEAHLAARRSVDHLAAHAVSLLGAVR